MNEEMTQQMMAAAERLATAAESLDRVLERNDAQQEALNAKVDRIVAAVEEQISAEAVVEDQAPPDLQAAALRTGEGEYRSEGAGGAACAEDPAGSGVGFTG